MFYFFLHISVSRTFDLKNNMIKPSTGYGPSGLLNHNGKELSNHSSYSNISCCITDIWRNRSEQRMMETLDHLNTGLSETRSMLEQTRLEILSKLNFQTEAKMLAPSAPSAEISTSSYTEDDEHVSRNVKNIFCYLLKLS